MARVGQPHGGAVGETELGNASLQGMVRELRRRHDDRFSEYFSPEALASFNEQIEGHFSGIGLSVVAVKKGLRVASVFPRSPAEQAGIVAGDTIVSVEGQSIAGESSGEATKKIKGPEGTEVTIGVRDAKGGKVRKLTLTRAEVVLPNVSHKTETVDGLELGFALWSGALLLVGIRAVHGWSWWRSLGVLALVALFLAAFAYLPSVF